MIPADRPASCLAPSPAPRPHLRHWPRRLPRELVVPQTTLWFNLEVTAARYPDKAACVFLGQALSFRQLHADAETLAGWLQAQGVGQGDRVVLFMQNCPQFLVAFYAVQRCAAVVVPVNPMNRVDELGHYITDPGARLVICGADGAPVVAQALAGLPESQRPQALLVVRYADALPAVIAPELTPSDTVLAWLYADGPLPVGATRWADALAQGARPAGPPLGGADDLAILPYTSGTTGMPKGCMHSHRTLMHNAIAATLWGYSGADSVSLGVVPFFHITGMMYGVVGPVMTGATVIILPRWDRELAGRLISHHRVTHWTCIPTMIIDLMNSPNLARFDLSSLIYLSGGGAAMPQAVATRLRDELGLQFCEGYGLTETAGPSHGTPGAAQAAVPGHAHLWGGCACRRPGHRPRAAARRSGRDHRPRAHGVSRLLAAARGDGRGLHRVRGAALLPHR